MNDDDENQVVLESVYVEMDPVLEGFEGALVELVFNECHYVLTETALGSGNRIFTFVSSNYGFAYRLFLEHTTAASGVQRLFF